MQDHKPLRLLAKDRDDLNVFSITLQDALCPTSSFDFDEERSTFSLLLNRFCWEDKSEREDGKKVYFRIHSGLIFAHVKAVHKKGFAYPEARRTLNLLNIEVEEAEDKSEACIYLIFSEGREVALTVSTVYGKLHDLEEEPWPTFKKPDHEKYYDPQFDQSAA